MKVLCIPRCAGKSYQAIFKCHVTGCQMVTFSKEESDRVFQMAKELGFVIKEPITMDELISIRGKNNKMDLIIDNSDLILERMVGRHEIKMITVTCGEYI